MILYDLLSPTQPCTFYAPDRQVAALATLILSNGMFRATAVEPADPELDVRMFPFGGAMDWWNDTFEEPMQTALDRRHVDVAKALESVSFTTPETRPAYDKAIATCETPEDIEAFSLDYNGNDPDDLTNIVTAARAHAYVIRTKYASRIAA